MLSDQDDILLKKLQRTINSWSAEVTDAHQKLTSQIGDARNQLDKLIGVLGSHKDTQAAKSPITRTGYQQWTPPTQGPEPSPEEETEAPPEADSTGQLEHELDDSRAELARLKDVNAELTRQVTDRKYEGRATASALEVARQELRDLRQTPAPVDTIDHDAKRAEMQRTNAELRMAQLEIDSLTYALEAIKSDLVERESAQDERNLDIEADLQTAGAFIQEQLAEIENLKQALATEAARSEQLTRSEHELQAALKENRAASEQYAQAIAKLESERGGLHGDFERLMQQKGDLRLEAESLRKELDKSKRLEIQLGIKNQSALREIEEAAALENELKAEAQSLRQLLDEAGQLEAERREELTSIKLEYERQSETLAESVKELEAHWKLAEQAAEAETRLVQRIDGLESQLNETEEALDQARREPQPTGQVIERERHAHALELAKKQERIIALEQHNERIAAMTQTLETQIQGLEVTLEGQFSAADNGPRPDPSELEELRSELQSFEEKLVEREQAVEAAAAKMKALEETALAVQAQVATLHKDRRSAEDGADLEEAQREVEALQEALAEAEARDQARADRMQRTEDELIEHRLRLDTATAERDEALTDSADMPHILNEALAEIDALKERIADREAEIDALKHERDETDRPFEIDFPAHDDTGKKRSMGEILIESKIITPKQLESALEEQRTAKKRRLGSILVEKGLIREEIVAQVVASQLKLPFVRLDDQHIEKGALALMDGRLATHHMCFPIRATSEEITVAMANPLDLIAIEDLEFATSVKVNPVVATLSDITSAVVQHYGVSIAETIAEDNFQAQTPPKLPAKKAAPKNPL